MSTEYIERGALLEEIQKHIETIGANAERLVARFPAADVASAEAYAQIMWERDIAIGQLAEYGIGFGEKKKDVVPVVHAHWEKVYADEPPTAFACSKCGREELYCNTEFDYCPHCGARMDERSEHED